MAIYHHRWVKIYLFYGVIFFLLGLTGYLAKHEGKIESWSVANYRKLNDYISGLFQVDRHPEETTVMADRQQQIIFLIYSNGRNTNLNKFIQNKIQATLAKKFRSIIPITVDNLINLELVYEDFKLQETPWILTGYNRIRSGSNNSREFKNQLYVSCPEESLRTISAQIFLTYIEILPNLIIQKQLGNKLRVIEFSWVDNNETDCPDQELLNSLLEILYKEIPKVSKGKPI